MNCRWNAPEFGIIVFHKHWFPIDNSVFWHPRENKYINEEGKIDSEQK